MLYIGATDHINQDNDKPNSSKLYLESFDQTNGEHLNRPDLPSANTNFYRVKKATKVRLVRKSSNVSDNNARVCVKLATLPSRA